VQIFRTTRFHGAFDLPDNTQFRARDQRKPNHHWADNEVLDDYASRIGPYGYAVYMYICRWAGNSDGRCTRSQREIASAFGISTDTVGRAVQKLIEARLLTKQDDPGRPSEFIVMEVPKRFERPAAHSGTHLPPTAGTDFAHSVKGVPPTAERSPLTAAHLPPTAAPNKEARLSQDFSQNLGAGRPAWGAASGVAWTIAQKQFWDEFERQAPPTGSYIANAEAERFHRFRAAANRVGLSATQAKKILLEHPAWRHWPYTADLDSREEITFSEPEKAVQEKPGPAATQTVIGQTMVVQTQVVQKLAAPASPESEAQATSAWDHVNDFVKARISANSYNTWLKPLRAVSLNNDGRLVVRVPTPEFKHVGKKFGEIIAQAIADRQGGDRRTDAPDNRQRVTEVKFVTQEELAEHPRARSA
jgi:DNA-binding MarR family transcriptional regulator